MAVRQKLYVNAYKDELGIILQEASAVKEELESIMNNTVELSRNVTDDIDCRLQEYRDVSVLYSAGTFPTPVVEKHEEPAGTVPRLTAPLISEQDEPSRKRVYEVARDMNVSCKDLLDRLRKKGIPVKNHLSLIEPDALLMETGSKASPEMVRAVWNSEPDGSDDAAEAEKPSLAPANELRAPVAAHAEGEDFTIEDLKQAHPYIAVRTLYEQGFAVWEIAKKLDRGQGEVNLILNITRKKQAQSL